MNKTLVWILKIAFSLGVLAILAWRASREGSLQDLIARDKNWMLLALGGFGMLVTLILQFFRWRVLVRALHLRLSGSEAMRLGFMSQTFSLIGVGMLGGDALKTFFLGRNNRGRITESLTTVFIDRVVGLYGLIVLAGIVCCFYEPAAVEGQDEVARAAVLRMCQVAPWAAAVSTVLLLTMFIPGVTTWPAWDALAGLPKVGTLFEKLVCAMRMYRARPDALAISVVLSLMIHGFNCLTFYCISLGLLGFNSEIPAPSLTAHATAALLALATGALPVGALEIVFNVVFRSVADPRMPSEQGFLIVLAYRMLQLCIAVIGLYYYLLGRREVDELLHEAERAHDHQQETTTANEAMASSAA